MTDSQTSNRRSDHANAGAAAAIRHALLRGGRAGARAAGRSLLLAMAIAAVEVRAQPVPAAPPTPDTAGAVAVDAAIDGDVLRLHWRIPDGQYLLASKFAAQSANPAVVLAPITPPAGETLHDPFFGAIQILRGEARLAIPFYVRDADAGLREVQISVTSQGCLDDGDCLPAQTRRILLPLPASATTAATLPPSAVADSLAALNALVGARDDAPSVADASPLLDLSADANTAQSGGEFLDPDQAFKPRISMLDAVTVLATWQIADGYYLYREKMGASTFAGATVGALRLPPGKIKDDEYFGRMEVYYQEARAEIPVQHGLPGGGVLELDLSYQGCADAGLCYPPITRTLAVTVPPGGGGSPVTTAVTTAVTTEQAPASPPAAPGAASAAAVQSAAAAVVTPEQDRIAQSLVQDNTWLVVLSFFGFGLLLSFTPCVLPMIPILSSIIVGQGRFVTTRRAFTLSLVYVLAMAFTYTVAGVTAGLFGANIQAVFQDPWVLSAFSAVFVVLALSMFGLYDLQLPTSMQAALARLSNKQAGGQLLGVAVMGLLSALIVGPCVAAPLAGALIYIGQTGDAVLGGLALFSLSLGMGVPLLVVGTSAGRLMPRAGPWMIAVKAVFGVALLGVAIYLLERIIPEWVSLLLWASLCIVSAIYMGALDSVDASVSGWRRLGKGSGLVVLTYGVLLMVGAASGRGDLFQPLKGLALGGGAQERVITFERVKGPDGLRVALDAAARAGKPVMLDYYADWCVSCKEMERYTFSDASVMDALAGTVLLQADVTANDEQDKALLRAHGLYGPPAILFYGPDGGERQEFRVVGFMQAEPFRRIVEQATATRPGAASREPGASAPVRVVTTTR